jgi:ABC-2 type transport system ATP-binding protein
MMTQSTEQLDSLTTDAGTATSANDLVIKCVGLSKIYRDFWMRNRVTAVNHIDMEVRRGEVFGLLGPNGSGKSTTIKMILGLLHATSGRIAVFNHHPRDVAIKKNIGYLPEESYLYRFLNARETLDYYAQLFGQNRRQRKLRIDSLLKMVGLDRVARRPVGEYSKGMQRRIGLAQALINDPQLLILDEPTTGLDPIGTRQIKDLIVHLAQKGKTILLCSHLLADVEDVCSRVAIMYGGKIRQTGSVSDLLVQRNVTNIQTELLDSETIEQIEQILQQKGLRIDSVENPHQKLEQLFLDIVHQAQQEGLSTQGATSGGQIATFLSQEDRGAHLPKGAQGAAILDDLISETTEPVTPLYPASPTPKSINHEPASAVLDDLVTAKKPAPAPAAPTSSDQPADDPPQPDADQTVLDSLLSAPSDDEKTEADQS